MTEQPKAEMSGKAASTGDQFLPAADQPLHEEVTAWLLRQITSGRWPVHHKLLRETLLAAELGISRGTLRRAIGTLVQQGILSQVHGRGTYVAAIVDTELKTVTTSPWGSARETPLIGVVVPSTDSQFVAQVLTYLEYALHERGYRMVLTNSQGSLAREGEHLRQLVELGVAGMVLYPGSFLHDEMASTLVRRGVPLVLLDRYFPAIRTHTVSSNHLQGSYRVVEHLLKLGHRRIGYHAGLDITTSVLARIDGYKAALKDFGVPFDEDLVLAAQPREETLRVFLQREPRATALACQNDPTAMDCLQLLQRLGLGVPEDVALVGFDDIPIASRVTPPLTTVAQNVSQLGQASANLVMDAVEGRVTAPVSIVIPTELVVRQSCGAHLPAARAS
jgi:GntR family transcriptional regulator of arabinose operon